MSSIQSKNRELSQCMRLAVVEWQFDSHSARERREMELRLFLCRSSRLTDKLAFTYLHDELVEDK